MCYCDSALAGAAFIGIFFFAVPFPIIILAAALLGFAGHFSATAFPPGGGHAPVDINQPAAESLLGEGLLEHARPTIRPVRVWPFAFDAPVLSSLDPWAFGLSLAAAVAIFWFKSGMIPTLVSCCAAGVVLHLAGAIR